MDNIKLQTEYYKKKLKSCGPSLEALGWNSPASQRVRFEALASIGDLNGCSVLDVGCGFGDFFGYLGEKDIILSDYLGIDLVEGMITEACRKYPEADFETTSILEPAIGYYDFVFASGIFGLESPDWSFYVRCMLARMFEICKVGVSVNFLSVGRGSNLESHYTDPDVVADLFCDVNAKIKYKLDYKLNDFTMFIYRCQ